MAWSQRVLNLRKSLRLSQRQMADLFAVSPGTISLWEKEQRNVPGPAQRLVEVLEHNHLIKVENELDSFTAHPWRRFFSVAGVAKGYGKNWVKDRLRPLFLGREKALNAQKENSEAMFREFIRTLSDLRGLQFKIVQMFSTMGEDLPEDFRNFLKSDQYLPSALPPNEVAMVFLENLSEIPENLFSEWQPLPFALGSISQVHHAKHDGTEVAVKVQYPDIVEALRADLQNVRVLVQFLSKVAGFPSPDTFIGEIKERFLDECDYGQEKKNILDFSSAFANQEEIVIPRVFDTRCSEQILTMELMKGQTFEEMRKSKNQQEKNHFAELIFRFHFQSIYQFGLFNADPHPGNYLYRDGKLIVLDFGCVRRYEPEQIDRFRKMFQTALANDLAGFQKANIEMGNVGNPARFDFQYHIECTQMLLEPVIAKDGDFAFNHHYVRMIYAKLVKENPNLRFAKIVPETVFLHRLQFGLYSMLADLNALGDWQSIYRETTKITQEYQPLHSILK